MNKAVEILVAIALIIFSFFIGVKYSESVKNRAGWLFENKEEEVELPDLSGESAVEGEVQEDSSVSGEAVIDPAAAPAASEESAPAAANATAPAAAPVK